MPFSMDIILVSILTFITGIIGTVTGFGTSTIMVPLVLLFLPLPQTLLLVGIIHFFGDVWKIVLFREGLKWKIIMAFGIPGAIASFLGARLIFSLPEATLSRLLGMTLVLYAAYTFANPSFKLRERLSTAAGAGVVSGFLAGIFGVGGAVRAMVLSAFDLPKAVYIATSGAAASAIDIVRLGAYVLGGASLSLLQLRFLPLFIVLSFLGARAGQKLVGHIPQRQFRMVIGVFLFLVGLRLFLLPPE